MGRDGGYSPPSASCPEGWSSPWFSPCRDAPYGAGGGGGRRGGRGLRGAGGSPHMMGTPPGHRPAPVLHPVGVGPPPGRHAVDAHPGGSPPAPEPQRPHLPGRPSPRSTSPLSRLLSLYVAATQGLHDATRTFLQIQDGGHPLSSSGWRAPWPWGSPPPDGCSGPSSRSGANTPKVDLIATDGFLLPNKVLREQGMMERKGFPESYDPGGPLRLPGGHQGGKAPGHRPGLLTSGLMTSSPPARDHHHRPPGHPHPGGAETSSRPPSPPGTAA